MGLSQSLLKKAVEKLSGPSEKDGTDEKAGDSSELRAAAFERFDNADDPEERAEALLALIKMVK